MHKTTIMTIAIFGNWYKKSTLDEVAHVLDFMESRGVEVLLSQELRDEMNLREKYAPYTSDTKKYVDFALSIGGDGTFLYTASVIGERSIPILGINCGRLGFLADVQTSEVDFVCDQLVQNNYTIEQRQQLQVTASYGGHVEHPYALNEVAVRRFLDKKIKYLDIADFIEKGMGEFEKKKNNKKKFTVKDIESTMIFAENI